MLLDTDPLKIDRVHQRIMAGGLGPAIVPRWSFVSITEISEYVQSPEQFGERLVAEGMDAERRRIQDSLERLRRSARGHESPAADAGFSAVSGDLLLSDEQEAQGRRELVHAVEGGTQSR